VKQPLECLARRVLQPPALEYPLILLAHPILTDAPERAGLGMARRSLGSPHTRALIVTGHTSTAGPLDLPAALGADTSAPGAAIIN
jgi:hypothetical protein